jgi:macrolide transport system ATP-binding/permease protein
VPVPVIDVRGITRTYHVGDVEIHALKGVSFAVDPGEFVAIVGASGSGKSTLMSILGCLDRPTSGSYFFEGIDISRASEPELARIRAERLGFVFQSFNLLARTTALDNVALPLFYRPSGPPPREDRLAIAREMLDMVGLHGREHNTPSQLSGGQQQRVAIARALINSPSVIFADEPTGNLDTATSHDIMNMLVSLNRDEGVTIVLVTHEADIAAYAGRVITVRDGEIVSDERREFASAPFGHDGEAADAGAAAMPHPAAQHPAAQHSALSHPSLPRPAVTRPAAHAAARRASAAGAGGGGGTVAFVQMVAAAAVQAIVRNKLRSALTMLGVFIGVAALIAMVALGEGASSAVREQIESLGTNLLVIVPGATTAGGVRGGFGSAGTLTVADAEALERVGRAVGAVGYLARQSGQVQYANHNWTTGIEGVSPSYPAITNWTIAAGRGFTEQDESAAALVALIGQTVSRQLFGPSANPVGATILVKGSPMRVVGLLGSKGQTAFGQDQDDIVMIPFTTAERKVLGATTPAPLTPPAGSTQYPPPPNPFGVQPRLTGVVNSIYVQAASPSRVDEAVEEVTRVLAERHHIQRGETNDFSVRNLSQIASAAEGSSRVLALLLAAVASISLLVGGIGIMNILLVSVTERTREIGLRMAIGARRVDVLLQFLAEAVFLSVAGGVVGIVIGVGASFLLSAVAGWPTQVSPTAIAGGFGFSAAVGVFFGYYPARKASRLDPIEALRYE